MHVLVPLCLCTVCVYVCVCVTSVKGEAVLIVWISSH